MPTTFKSQYGTSNQTITITVTALGNNGQRQSTNVSNATDLYLDVLAVVKVKTASASTSSTGYVNVYAYGSANTGSSYPEGITGTDGSVTLTSPTNLRLIGVINAVANSTTYESLPLSVAAAFNGTLPERWGIVVENKTGATLDASVGSAWYQGIYNQGA